MTSRSPFGDVFDYELNEAAEQTRLQTFLANNSSRHTSPSNTPSQKIAAPKTVVVQGLGFVGTAMAAAVANATDANNNALYTVIGVDLPDERNYWKIARVNNGLSPVVSTDASLDAAYTAACARGNLTATYSAEAYKHADIVVVDIHLDIRKNQYGLPHDYSFSYDGYLAAIRAVAENVREGVLVIIETTVPPGTTEKVIKPLFEEVWKARGLDVSKLYLAHSYERVMPGKEYLSSITNFFRVYSGVDAASRSHARAFLESFINTKDFPLTELHSTTASEMSKVLENSFRAANIAFMQEWTEFAQTAGVNLFDVVQAIRVRPTHRNIMAPGLGVGGYCLTKDSLLADWSYMNLFGSPEHLGVSLNAIRVNDTMPEFTHDLIRKSVGDLRGRHITILGVSYLNDVADTRYSPSETLYNLCERGGAIVQVHDTIVSYWTEKDCAVETSLDALRKLRHDVAVFAVRHSAYLAMTADDIVAALPSVGVVIDAMNILSDATAAALTAKGIKVRGIGKGHW